MLTPVQKQFLITAAAAAIASEGISGCPAELTLAQAILESGWGAKAPQFNCFGTKYFVGAFGRQLLDTHEWFTPEQAAEFLAGDPAHTATVIGPVNAEGKFPYKCRDWFATFASLAEAFADHGYRIVKAAPYAAAWAQYQQDKDLQEFIRGVAKHYATSPTYAADIFRILAMPEVDAAITTARQGI